ncbi:DUF2326 domain-containing protein [Acinetobacter sp. yr461]|uniref:DUF2326 domain-containing protein n=1 Tax=Acinetobacter sp. yr461 TaxID=1761742 RepID=UPI0008BAE9EE|nr:DUF2326 domain-containing protein [Acinetobacter sp. yr461]SEO13022.1 Uncharacterized protein YydD, contains DUF2326 domain [Acinetobacter sp. yr461]
MKLNKLYSVPEIFSPINFYSGMNIILGDKNDTTVKTNGVGKSLCVDFINFCLLKTYKDTRHSKIPKHLLNDSFICLNFDLKNKNITIKRSSKNPNHIFFKVDNKIVEFIKLEDAKDYLNNLYFNDSNHYPSFRTLMGPIIRDESSEFKSIINCYDTQKRIPPDYSPHLYFFGINPQPYKEVKNIISEIGSVKNLKAKIKKDIKTLTGLNFNEAHAVYNELNSEILNLQNNIDNLQFADSFEDAKLLLLNLENQIKAIKSEIAIHKSELKKINLFSGDNYININEVAETYKFYSQSLGDLVSKNLEEIISFKNSIDNFQKSILSTRTEYLKSTIKKLEDECDILESKFHEQVKLLDDKNLFSTLKISIGEYHRKLSEQLSLLNLIKSYDKFENELKKLNALKANALLDLNQFILENEKSIKKFESNLLSIYQIVMKNQKCSFNIQTNNTKEILDFNLRISDDGSHSVDREKVFLYDISLLITDEFKYRHPNFLIHDNIFDMDQDTADKNFNFLLEYFCDLFNNFDKQYIFTLSIDKYNIDFINSGDIDIYTIARFTKNKKFLNFNYSEID